MSNRIVIMIGGLLILFSLLLFSSQGTPAQSLDNISSFLIPEHPLEEQQTITIQFGGVLGEVYSPADVRISPGDSVQWQGDFVLHPLVSDDGLWQMVSSGTQFTQTYTQPGVYPYHCAVHNILGMNGTVTVGYFGYLPLITR